MIAGWSWRIVVRQKKGGTGFDAATIENG